MNVLEVLRDMAKFAHAADAAFEAVRGTPAAAAAVKKDNRFGWQEQYDKLLEVADRTEGTAASVRSMTALIEACDSFEGDGYQKATGYRPANLRMLGEAIRDYDAHPQPPNVPLESIETLRKQSVGPSQICSIWGINPGQLKQEIEQPGSVIGTQAFIDHATEVWGYSLDCVRDVYGVSTPVETGWVAPWVASHQRALAAEREVFDAAMVRLREVLATAREHRQQETAPAQQGANVEDYMRRKYSRPMPPNPVIAAAAAQDQRREERNQFIDNAHR